MCTDHIDQEVDSTIPSLDIRLLSGVLYFCCERRPIPVQSGAVLIRLHSWLDARQQTHERDALRGGMKEVCESSDA